LDRALTAMREPNYDGFWKALPDAALCRDEWDINEGFRHSYREEIIGLLNMLHRLGLVWGATALHPEPPSSCDLCGCGLTERQTFVDGVTADGRWAIMCPKCFIEEGLAIGPLTGQLYLQVEAGKWRMVVGSDRDGEDDTTLSLPQPLKTGFLSRLTCWLRTSIKRNRSEKAKPQPQSRTHCGTPYIWMGARPGPSADGSLYSPPSVHSSLRRPTHQSRKR
jgi:hypothetical protein